MICEVFREAVGDMDIKKSPGQKDQGICKRKSKLTL